MWQVPTVVGPLWVDRWDRSVGKNLRLQAEYESRTTRWLMTVTTPGMVVVDIGANIGYFTVLFGRYVGPAGRVLAFEPAPFNRELLARNVRDNGMAEWITIDAAAVTDREGTERFYIHNSHSGVHSLSAANLAPAEGVQQIKVPATTLDAAVARAGLAQVDIVKIDAQGAETQILRGAAQTLSGPRLRTVLLELWPFGLENCGGSAGEVAERLRDWGFNPSTLTKRGAEPLSWGDVLQQAAALTDHGSINLVLTK